MLLKNEKQNKEGHCAISGLPKHSSLVATRILVQVTKATIEFAITKSRPLPACLILAVVVDLFAILIILLFTQ